MYIKQRLNDSLCWLKYKYLRAADVAVWLHGFSELKVSYEV
ncbi:hypothetical protein PRUB_a0236 [Pseudoalteromonas rubra]|uniref:Uncharacterized protein n=1 Tax=Pseudoalteromonas rubra TaxID=43658 RepID=A0A8T0C720_9GAMM|nr:hypothetical protein PRUB_a0236 [Pseudoalteromonas rubra]